MNNYKFLMQIETICIGSWHEPCNRTPSLLILIATFASGIPLICCVYNFQGFLYHNNYFVCIKFSSWSSFIKYLSDVCYSVCATRRVLND